MHQLRILVASQILVPLTFCGKFESSCLSRIASFSRSHKKIDFDTHCIKTQSLNFPEKVAGNHNIREPSQNFSSLTNMLVLPSDL